MAVKIVPVHPGLVLKMEFMEPLGLTAYSLAQKLKVERTRIERLVREQAPVTPDTALRLAKAFGTSPQLWLNMQARYDVSILEKEKAAEIADIPRLIEA